MKFFVDRAWIFFKFRFEQRPRPIRLASPSNNWRPAHRRHCHFIYFWRIRCQPKTDFSSLFRSTVDFCHRLYRFSGYDGLWWTLNHFDSLDWNFGRLNCAVQGPMSKEFELNSIQDFGKNLVKWWIDNFSVSRFLQKIFEIKSISLKECLQEHMYIGRGIIRSINVEIISVILFDQIVKSTHRNRSKRKWKPFKGKFNVFLYYTLVSLVFY